MSSERRRRGWVHPAAWAVMALWCLVVVPAAAAGIPAMAGSKHDFRGSAHQALSTLAGDEVCRGCHIPHNAAKESLLQDFRKDWVDPPGLDSTGKPHVFLPNSVLCLGCHDGTIAAPTTPAMTDTIDEIKLTSNGNPTDLHFFNDVLPGWGGRPDRPLVTPGLRSAVFRVSAQQWEAVSPVNTSTKLPLETDGVNDLPRMACTTCHDPHVENYLGTGVKFLRSDQAYGDLCVTCHSNLYPQ